MSIADSSDQQDLNAFYRSHHGWLYNWLRKRIGCSHNAADLAQDTFLRIISSKDMILGLREPRAFLTTTAKRLIIDQARRRVIEQAYLTELSLLMEGMSGYPSPEQILSTLQALNLISAALDGLSSNAREAFLLHYLEGQTHAVIADSLGVSTKMVQKYLIKALLHISHIEID